MHGICVCVYTCAMAYTHNAGLKGRRQLAGVVCLLLECSFVGIELREESFAASPKMC